MTARRLGYWSAIATAVLAAAFMGIGFLGTTYQEGIPYPYILSAIRPADYAVWIPGLLLAPSFVVLMACLHQRAAGERKIFSQIGLSFALIYATLIISDYFIQLTAVLPSIMSGETAGLALFSIYNPHGIFVAVESLGYLMLNAALLAVAGTFSEKSGPERALRLLFVIAFFLAAISFLGVMLGGSPIVVFEVIIIAIDVVVLIAAGFLLCRLFRGGEASQKTERS